MNDLKNFVFQYNFNNEVWAITVPAKTIEEAKEKIKVISQAEYVGEENCQHYLQG